MKHANYRFAYHYNHPGVLSEYMFFYPLFTTCSFLLLSWMFARRLLFSDSDNTFTRKPILNRDLLRLIERVKSEANIPGLTIGVVRSNGHFESWASGVRDEDGTDMTVDVSSRYRLCYVC